MILYYIETSIPAREETQPTAILFCYVTSIHPSSSQGKTSNPDQYSNADRISFSYMGNPPVKFNCSLGLPGMLAPIYHEFVCGKRVLSDSSVTRFFHRYSASLVASMVLIPCFFILAM